MPAERKKYLTVRKRETSGDVLPDGVLCFTEDEFLKEWEVFSITCDSPRHAARFGDNKPIVLNSEAMMDQSRIEELPVEYFKTVTLMPDPTNSRNTLIFCGPQCCKDWLTYSFVPVKHPKEVLEELRVAAEKQNAQQIQEAVDGAKQPESGSTNQDAV